VLDHTIWTTRHPEGKALDCSVRYQGETDSMTTPSTRKFVWTALAVAALMFTPAAAFAGDAAAGKVVFDANCLSCHGATGAGDGPVGAALQPPPRNFAVGDFAFDTDGDGEKGTDADLKNVITKGGMAYGGSPLMAPWPMLSETDIDNVIAFIQTLKQ
jgi:mono/diheme cytochrome c family protein